jgi:hypothetical protein
MIFYALMEDGKAGGLIKIGGLPKVKYIGFILVSGLSSSTLH